MVSTKRGLIATTLVIASYLLCLISITTENWLRASAVLSTRLHHEINYGIFAGCLSRQQLASTLVFDLAENAINDKAYIPTCWWLCVLLSLMLTIVFNICASTFALINVCKNPVERIFNVFGLFIWNGVAAISAFLTVGLWTSLYFQHLTYNISITDTLRSEFKFNSNGRAKLGYSVYLLLFAGLLNACNLGVLWLRQPLLTRTHAQPTIALEETNIPLQFY